MKKQIERLFEAIERSGKKLSLVAERTTGPDGEEMSPIVGVTSVDDDLVVVNFFKTYGKESPYWGAMMTIKNEKKSFLTVTKVTIEELEKLCTAFSPEKIRAMMKNRTTRYSVVGGEVRKNEFGPFSPDGNLNFGDVLPDWKIGMTSNLEPIFAVPEEIGREEASKIIQAYERKYNLFCQWMVSQLITA